MENEIVVQETIPQTDVVSIEQTKQETITPEPKSDDVEFKLPTTKEEYETQIKSAVNREKTNFLKELGVKSVKEYKEQLSKSQEALSKYDEAIKESQALTQKHETLSHEYDTLKQTNALDRLGVRDEYREDLIKLAKDKVTENEPIETVLKNLVETKYQYTVQGKSTVKFGTEKSTQTTSGTESSIPTGLQNKYPFLK